MGCMGFGSFSFSWFPCSWSQKMAWIISWYITKKAGGDGQPWHALTVRLADELTVSISPWESTSGRSSAPHLIQWFHFLLSGDLHFKDFGGTWSSLNLVAH